MKLLKRCTWVLAAFLVVSIVTATGFTAKDQSIEKPSASPSAEATGEEYYASQVQYSAPPTATIAPEAVVPAFAEVDELVYTTSAVNLRTDASLDSDIQQVVECSTNLHRVGIGEEWSEVEIEGAVFYVSNDHIEIVTEERLRDIELLARTIHAESGNQSEEGQRAVGSVIMNRRGYTGYGGSDTIEGVISFPNQFSSYHNENWWADYSDLTYRIATEVYDGYTNLPEDVRCFKTTYCKANWDLEFYKQIGDHNFYYLP